MATKLTDTITLYDRDEWGARAPEPMTEQGWDAHEVFLHHSDDSYRGLDSLDEQKARMRGYQDFHMDVRGWSDIAYHAVVFPPFTTAAGTKVPARIFQGRERHYVPAAQEKHNTGTLAVCVVGKYTVEYLHTNTIYAIEVYLKDLKERGAPLRTLGGHRDVVATTCPGGILYREVGRIAEQCGLAVYRG